MMIEDYPFVIRIKDNIGGDVKDIEFIVDVFTFEEVED